MTLWSVNQRYIRARLTGRQRPYSVCEMPARLPDRRHQTQSQSPPSTRPAEPQSRSWPRTWRSANPQSRPVDTLKAAWFGHLDKQYEWELIDRGVEKDSWDAIKAADPMAPKEENVVVKEELKGLWTIDGIHSVVEGECPVCAPQILRGGRLRRGAGV